jgi:hypothetical protein
MESQCTLTKLKSVQDMQRELMSKVVREAEKPIAAGEALNLL